MISNEQGRTNNYYFLCEKFINAYATLLCDFKSIAFVLHSKPVLALTQITPKTGSVAYKTCFLLI